MSRIVPILIAVAAIVALTVVEGLMSDRWGDNRHSAYCATLLEQVPKEIGPWTSQDGEVDELVQETAGARGYVSRSYHNPNTGESVGVWLIVGHARDTARHTPDVCYQGNGFELDTTGMSKHAIKIEGAEDATFWEARFVKAAPLGERVERVFWAWFKPEAGSGEPVQWSAPDSARYEFGAAPALYKIYFTTSGQAAEVSGDKSSGEKESVCLRFAREFLPVVEPLLAPANGEIPADFDASTVKEV